MEQIILIVMSMSLVFIVANGKPLPIENIQCFDPQAPCKCNKILTEGSNSYVQFTCDKKANDQSGYIPAGFQCSQLTREEYLNDLKQTKISINIGCELRCTGKSCKETDFLVRQ
ncbi:uncharacterized protein LOC130646301 [Hydractinia symbiolongicarpus]|uniref:uncharacterized protein LOC130646301 n=1 Tax=Hydractinia symbiolongicarpus TaxID=13093 RepID=UPI00254E20AE|nr:uncharacterized protein LOC130646301 [Hydractinia symbiolongicarpus]